MAAGSAACVIPPQAPHGPWCVVHRRVLQHTTDRRGLLARGRPEVRACSLCLDDAAAHPQHV